MQATTVDQARLKNGAIVQITVDKYTVRKYELPSRMWCGQINDIEVWKTEHVERSLTPVYKVGTIKALKIDAIPVMAESVSCLSCGIHLETDTSRLFGYCLSCAGIFAIPNWVHFDDEQLEELRTHLPEPFRRRDFWIQLATSDVEILEDAPPTEQPVVDWDVRFVIHDGSIVVTCADIERFRPLVRSVPGYRWDSRYNVWRFNATPATALALKTAFDGYARKGTKEFISLVKKAESQKSAQGIKARTDLPPIPGVKGNGGWLHQRVCFNFCYRILTGEDYVNDD